MSDSSNSNCNSSSRTNKKKSSKTDIFLPSEDYLVQSWKVKSGSIVRIGETIAIAIAIDTAVHKDSIDSTSQNNSETSSIASSSASAVAAVGPAADVGPAAAVGPAADVGPAAAVGPVATTEVEAHKRPNRRRRGAAPSTDNASQNTSSSSTTTTTTASAQSFAISKPSSSTAADSKSATIPKLKLTTRALAEKLSSTDSIKNTCKDSHSHSQPHHPATTTTTTTTKQTNSIPILATADGLLRSDSPNPFSTAEPSKKRLIIGFIEECLHPGFMEGLCVVCGISIRQQQQQDDDGDDYYSHSSESTTQQNLIPVPTNLEEEYSSPSEQQQQANNNNNNKMSQVTVSGGITMTVSETEAKQIARQSSQRLWKQQKLSLVLDLDHTLVHATSDTRARHYVTNKAAEVRTLILPLMEGAPPGGPAQNPHLWMQHHVKLRPHLKEFLQSVQPYYEITVYTAGTRHYAEEITIVLCRHLVGAYRDHFDLEQLRYQVQRADVEYRKHHHHIVGNLLPKTAAAPNDEKKEHQVENGDHSDVDMQESSSEEDSPTKKRVHGDSQSGIREPPNKRRKVSFAPPAAIQEKFKQPPGNRSDHITLEQLEELKKELEDAERLEAEAWDLRQRVFGSRVVSRTDVGDLGRDVKSLKRIFPCGGTMAAVVDDREDVWANASDNSDETVKGEPPENLLLVRPYHWQPFLGFADVNNAAGDDLSGGSSSTIQGADPGKETDTQLLWTGQILKELHTRYYAQKTDESSRKTVPEVLSEMRREVLKGTKLVLSGLVPLHKKTLGTNAPRPPIIRYAQSMGAKLLDHVLPGVTHVVAAKDGTDKALAARKIPGCMLVKASWLVECFWSLTRRDVVPHLMDPDSAAVIEQQQPQMKIDDNSSEEDSEDDDLAAEFEDELMKM
jgi:hypothetical protein